MGKEFIYFEKQDDMMCGQHALNMLLQRDEFDPSVFAHFVERLDQREREIIGASSLAFRSQNASESGFFSIQVLTEALRSQNLSLFDLNKPQYAHYMFQPEEANAYIVNQSEHWFALRKFNGMWFILNSVSNGPRFISTSLLQPYFARLIGNRASIYLVEGDLGVSEADLAAMDGKLSVINPVMDENDVIRVAETVGNSLEDEEILKAIAASLETGKTEESRTPVTKPNVEEIQQLPSVTKPSVDEIQQLPPVIAPSLEEIRSKRAQFLDKLG